MVEPGAARRLENLDRARGVDQCDVIGSMIERGTEGTAGQMDDGRRALEDPVERLGVEDRGTREN